MPKLLQEFAREDECTATLQDGCRQLESRRIDVWRLWGFLDVSSSGIAGLLTPAAAATSRPHPLYCCLVTLRSLSKQRNTRN